MTITTDTLEVPGAKIHYEVRGTGPLLLCIPGGSGDAGSFDGVASLLADRYTVVSYDRRGFSRSRPAAPPDDRARLATDVDDAHHLLARLDGGPAYVLGSSSGAIVALGLLERHPGAIWRLVAHEPPLFALLPDPAPALAFVDDSYDTYRREGVETAMAKFLAAIGMNNPLASIDRAKLPPPVVAMMTRMHGNLEYWFEHEIRQYPRTLPDFAALEAEAARLVLAGGRDSRQYLPYQSTNALSERLGHPVVNFPGGHAGYTTHPAEFAVELALVLSGH